MDIRDHNGIPIDISRIEKPEQDLAKEYIQENDIVLELGARYGSVSCVINSKLNNKTNQVSVEPDERVWRALERNRDANDCKFHIVKGFISSKKLGLTEINSYGGYGTTSVVDCESKISSYTMSEIKNKYNLDFNVIVADCEGFLEEFFNENKELFDKLRLIIFEADYTHKCNYGKIKEYLKEIGLTKIREGHQNVWKR